MLCAVCEARWYRRGSAATCIECDEDMTDSLLWTAFLSTLIAVIVITLVLLDLRFGFSRAKAGSQRLKLMVNCVQQMTVMTLFPAKWPAAVKNMGALFAGISVDVSIVAPSCLGVPINFYTRFVVSASFVFASIIVPWVAAALASLATACRKKILGQRRIAEPADGSDGNGEEGDERVLSFGQIVRVTWHRMRPTAARYSLMIMLFAHPAVSGQTFFFFSCQEIEDKMYVKEVNEHNGMNTMKCRRWNERNHLIICLFVVSILMYVLLLPAPPHSHQVSRRGLQS